MAINTANDSTSVSNDSFIVYPNPTSDFVVISLPELFKKGTIFIYSLAGKKVLEQQVSQESASISLKSLEKGMYLYKMESVDFSKNGKIFKK